MVATSIVFLLPITHNTHHTTHITHTHTSNVPCSVVMLPVVQSTLGLAINEQVAKTTKRWSLAAEQELRIEVAASETLIVKLLSGSAEVFGTELASQKEYSFKAENFAIFSWKGAEIEVCTMHQPTRPTNNQSKCYG
jgi:hypothetical protein